MYVWVCMYLYVYMYNMSKCIKVEYFEFSDCFYYSHTKFKICAPYLMPLITISIQ